MIFLPVAERELRVASRKRSTFWLRVVAALVAVVIGCGCLALSMLGGRASAMLGSLLFQVLAWLALAAAVSAGLFFTSDCLSEEKREGTIGFLFLTDLRGYDVVFGKLAATSVRCLFALLAIFPILAVTQLMGGVSPAQFWKTVLALVHALLVSLAAGLFVSSISRDSQKALAGTFCLLLFLLGGGPALDGLVAGVRQQAPEAYWSRSSAIYVFMQATAWRSKAFWSALLIGQATTWLLFVSACLLIPRTWQTKAKKAILSTSSWAYRWKYGSVQRRTALRRRLIERNPVLWLACRERWQTALIWCVTLALLGMFAILQWAGLPTEVWQVWSTVGGFLTILLYLWVASQASRFLVEARQSGLLELLLAAPLSVKQIVNGQWSAMLRMFGAPMLLFLIANLIGTCLAQFATWGTLTAATGGNAPPVAMAVVFSVSSVVTTIGGLVALIWFGMWMGLTSRTNHMATLKTIVFVQIIPWFVASFVSVFVVMLLLVPQLIKMASTLKAAGPGGGPPAAFVSQMITVPMLMAGVALVLYLLKDVAFWLWSRKKLYAEFRERASQPLGPVRQAAPPPLSCATAVPTG